MELLEADSGHVILHLNNNNGCARGLALFAPFNKTAKYLKNTECYELDVEYYHLDKENIINRIISLGPSVTVIEPDDIKQEIIRRLKIEYTLLCSK